VVPRSSDRISRVPPYLIRPIELPIRGCHPLWLCFPAHSGHSQGSAGPRSLAATRGVSIDVLSSGYLDVSVPRVCLYNPMYSGHKYLFQLSDNRAANRPGDRRSPPTKGRHGVSLRSNNQKLSGGLPHSEICGSKPILGSPQLIAEYHVLHRLLLPRHSPNALFALDLIRKTTDALHALISGPKHTFPTPALVHTGAFLCDLAIARVSVLDLDKTALPPGSEDRSGRSTHTREDQQF